LLLLQQISSKKSGFTRSPCFPVSAGNLQAPETPKAYSVAMVPDDFVNFRGSNTQYLRRGRIWIHDEGKSGLFER
jgi:hypothetical protein